MHRLLKILLTALIALSLCACTQVTPENSTNTDPPHGTCDDPSGCDITPSKTEEGLKFKQHYESLNGVENSRGAQYRTIEIPEENNFEEISLEKLEELLNEGDPFILLVSDPKCPWCRSLLPYAVAKANEMKMGRIYVVNIWDEEGNEVFRDKYKLGENDALEEVAKGTEVYHRLLDMDTGVLADYSISDSAGNVLLSEKRLYAPNFIFVQDGKILLCEGGTSEQQQDPYGELTEQMIADMNANMEHFFTSVNQMIKDTK